MKIIFKLYLTLNFFYQENLLLILHKYKKLNQDKLMIQT